MAVPPQTAPLQVGPTLIEWNGGQRWVSQVGAAADFRAAIARRGGHATLFRFDSRPANVPIFHPLDPGLKNINRRQIGRASCRERVCQYVLVSVVAVAIKKKK